jgi:hypothetical protein
VLLTRASLDGIAAGTVDLAFRRWTRARVKPGTRLRTAIGVVAVEEIRIVSEETLTEDDAHRSGAASLTELVGILEGFGDAPIHRIVLRLDGPDPRVELRERSVLDSDELAGISARLERMDRASKAGPWTVAVLRCIAERPAVRAPDLAASFGRETLPFKRDVRKLKELGLTESLEVGYRLSPRGRAVLDHLS